MLEWEMGGEKGKGKTEIHVKFNIQISFQQQKNESEAYVRM